MEVPHMPKGDCLAELISSGDRESLARGVYPLVERTVRGYLYVQDSDVIQSAVSDAVLAICRYRHTFKGGTRASAWVRRIATREAARYARRERRHRRGAVSLGDEAARLNAERQASHSSHPLARHDAMRSLTRQVPNLAWRHIWLLWNQPGSRVSYEHIGRLTGYRPASVPVILSRVRVALNRTCSCRAKPTRLRSGPLGRGGAA